MTIQNICGNKENNFENSDSVFEDHRIFWIKSCKTNPRKRLAGIWSGWQKTVFFVSEELRSLNFVFVNKLMYIYLF